jgi:hypothetical protein
MPGLGTLDPLALESLVRDLDASRDDPSCVFALWEGDRWVTPANLSEPTMHLVRQSAWEHAGRFEGPLPVRRVYRTLSGRLGMAATTGTVLLHGLAVIWQPTIFWNIDGSFCVATDTDYDSTIVASDGRIQDRILRDPALEALPVAASNSLLAR